MLEAELLSCVDSMLLGSLHPEVLKRDSRVPDLPHPGGVETSQGTGKRETSQSCSSFCPAFAASSFSATSSSPELDPRGAPTRVRSAAAGSEGIFPGGPESKRPSSLPSPASGDDASTGSSSSSRRARVQSSSKVSDALGLASLRNAAVALVSAAFAAWARTTASSGAGRRRLGSGAPSAAPSPARAGGSLSMLCCGYSGEWRSGTWRLPVSQVVARWHRVVGASAEH
mmetsp:Transcript_36326/g.102627  ORF Transcript_36326/g.102627 Transcript_36326/m.102627 type:complete len:228 (-) Transcript_36326:91-774(-)